MSDIAEGAAPPADDGFRYTAGGWWKHPDGRKEFRPAKDTKPKKRSAGRSSGDRVETSDVPKDDRPKRSRRKIASDSDKREAAEQIYGLHQFSAMATGLHELAISREEAELLASPLLDTMELLGLNSEGVSKYLSPLSLIIACGIVYGPRVSAIKARAAADAAKDVSPEGERREPPAHGVVIDLASGGEHHAAE